MRKILTLSILLLLFAQTVFAVTPKDLAYGHVEATIPSMIHRQGSRMLFLPGKYLVEGREEILPYAMLISPDLLVESTELKYVAFMDPMVTDPNLAPVVERPVIVRALSADHGYKTGTDLSQSMEGAVGKVVLAKELDPHAQITPLEDSDYSQVLKFYKVKGSTPNEEANPAEIEQNVRAEAGKTAIATDGRAHLVAVPAGNYLLNKEEQPTATTSHAVLMDRAKGMTLKQYLQDGHYVDDPMSYLDILEKIQATIAAFQSAYQHGITHGDPHDENIMVIPSGAIQLIDYEKGVRLAEDEQLDVLHPSDKGLIGELRPDTNGSYFDGGMGFMLYYVKDSKLRRKLASDFVALRDGHLTFNEFNSKIAGYQDKLLEQHRPASPTINADKPPTFSKTSSGFGGFLRAFFRLSNESNEPDQEGIKKLEKETLPVIRSGAESAR